MMVTRNSTTLLTFLMALFALTSAASAGPQDYCAAYAGQIASSKTGLVGDDVVGTLGSVVEPTGQSVGPADRNDSEPVPQVEPLRGSMTDDPDTEEKWREAYEKAFGTCMDNYEHQPLTASVDAAGDADPPKLDNKQQKAKAPSSPRKAKASGKPRKARASAQPRKAKATSPSRNAKKRSSTKSQKARTRGRASASKSARTVTKTRVQGNFCTAKSRSVSPCKQKTMVPTTVKTEAEPATQKGQAGSR
jgi:hypothetical protein